MQTAIRRKTATDDGLRPVAPLILPGVARASDLGAAPKLIWVAPTSLLVDGTYQRDLSRNSLSLIKKMVAGFAWNRMKPPIVVQVGGGLHVVDGQHTAIAAATIGVSSIPVFVVEAQDQVARANAFVAHNRDRVTISSIDLHNALTAAGDPDALDVTNVCQRAGVRIRTLNQNSTTAEGDTMAVTGIRTLIKRRGVMRAREVLQALVSARRAPITRIEILAAEHTLCESNKTAGIDDLAAAIRIEGGAGLLKARAKAAQDRVPVWRVLAARYAKRLDGGAK